MSKNKIFSIIIVIIIVLGGLFLFVQEKKSITTIESSPKVEKLTEIKPLSGESTIYEAMSRLASTTAFTFKAKYYQGLGYFIEEINGLKNQNGYYWTLYVNDKYSEAGVSSYKLLTGDKIEWKYEKK